MNIAIKYTNYLNPGQIAVGCSDQPLYALKKTIQWMYPSIFGSTYFPFMGGLHIEQATLVWMGQLVSGTGIKDIITVAGLDTVGLVSAVCDVNSMKKARYTLQVIAVVLMMNLQKAYTADKEANDDGSHLTLEQWSTSQNSHMFQYWYKILHYIKVTLMLIRSFRESNFTLFISTLEALTPLFFALDHIHYSRWVSVFIYDLKTLPEKFPQLNSQFLHGSFTVNTKGVNFSNIAMDQGQEHSNKKIKAISGYIDQVNDGDRTFLRKLELCLPEINEYLTNMELLSKPQVNIKKFHNVSSANLSQIAKKYTRNSS